MKPDNSEFELSGKPLEETKNLLSYCKERYAKNSSIKWAYWVAIRLLYSLALSFKKTSSQKRCRCDVLILHPSEKSRKLDRKRKLIERIKSTGLTVCEDTLAEEAQILKEGLYESSNFKIYHLRIYDGYAKYLKRVFNPKVIITERNGHITSSFLKSKSKNDSVTLHLAHSVLTSESSRYNYIDYDYYCLYGISSLEHLKSLDNLYGSCRAFLGGSYLFDESFTLPPNPDAPIMLLGAGPRMEKEPSCIQIYEMVKEWQAKTNSELFVRLHPRSKGEFWKGEASEKIRVLKNENFIESARKCSLVISPYTNAVVDASLLNRPVQLLKCANSKDFLCVEDFFPKSASTDKELEKSIDKI
ncbi:hypothetical protein, partial [Sansalvadorimonas verongulae]|uniref:hypothetical protein n=1 Tax=Sansalvadorimonas verongulae TaxID=2172824 RepID=UPI0012BCBA8F